MTPLRRALLISLSAHFAVILLPGFSDRDPGPLGPEEGYISVAFLDDESLDSGRSAGSGSALEDPSEAAVDPAVNPAMESEPEPEPELVDEAEEVLPEAYFDEPRTADQTDPVDESALSDQVQPATIDTLSGFASPSESAPESGGVQGEAAVGSANSASTTGGAERGGDAFRPPRLLVGALPLSPEQSVELSPNQEIPVRLRVTKTGRVEKVESIDPDLDPRILAAVQKAVEVMRFVPAKRGGAAVDAWFAMKFIYNQ